MGARFCHCNVQRSCSHEEARSQPFHLLFLQAHAGAALCLSGSFRSAGAGATSPSGASGPDFPRLHSSRGLNVLASVYLAVGSAPGGARGWAPGGPLLRPSRSRGVVPGGFRTRSLLGRDGDVGGELTRPLDKSECWSLPAERQGLQPGPT